MSDLPILDEIEIQSRVYNQRMIDLGAFFGGPLAAGYLLINNYKALGQEEKVGITWAMAILGMMVYIGTAFAINYYVYDIPDIFYGLLSMWGARTVYEKEQAAGVEQYVQEGGLLYSGWQVFKVVMVVFALIMMVVAIVGAGYYFTVEEAEDIERAPRPTAEQLQVREDTTVGMASNVYGSLDHIISYDREDWASGDIDALADLFTSRGYFNQSIQKIVHIEIRNGVCMFFIIETSARAQNPAIQDRYVDIKAAISSQLNAQAIEIILVDDSWGNEFARL